MREPALFEESSTQEKAQEAPRASSALTWLSRLILGVALIGLLASQQGIEPVLRALQSVSWTVLAGAVAFYWVGQILSAYKWQLLLRAGGADVPLRECCRLYAIGMFCNLWLPSSIGGDAARAVLCRPLCGSATLAVTSIFLERLTGVIALVAIGLFGFAVETMWGRGVSSSSPEFALRVLAVSFAGVFTLALAIFLVKKLLRSNDENSKIGRLVAKLRRALALYSGRAAKRVLIQSLWLSLVFQTSQVLLNLALARAVGLQISPVTIWWAAPFLSLAALLPIGIGGLGVREVAAMQLLRGYSLPGNLILIWSLLWQATVWLSSLPGGLWWRGNQKR